ncbi:MAG TPA: DegT/DnrJ/EryC1/StrS family aminotransferase [Gemmataceae bacterium]|nr:DegT/DnrJ/EryC1/StrS family aminotransferase [Gemmataceae bacterium]
MRTASSREIPLCDIQASYRELQSQIDAAVQRVLASGQVILGPEVASLEREVAAYCGIGHAVGCGSGSDALWLALEALEIGSGDEVIVPPFTFFATANAVCRAGATPVFADIDPKAFNLDSAEVEDKITAHTRAIMPAHLFGHCADMDALGELAQRFNLAIIEDAAQAFGSEFHGKKAGSLGSLGCFSFYPTKTLGGFGEGGMVVTNRSDLAKRLVALRAHGMEQKYYHRYLGWNARLDALQAAILRVKLPHVEPWIEGRQDAARRYNALIDDYRMDEFMQKPVIGSGLRHTFNQYVVRVPSECRDSLVRCLKSEKIGCEVYYPQPVHLQECLAHLGYRTGDFPHAEEACRTVLALPMFPELTAEQQERVIRVCANFARQRSLARVA